MNRERLFFWILVTIIILMIGTIDASAQRLKHEPTTPNSKLKGKRKDGENIIEFVNGVKYTQKSTIIFCDSSLYYKSKNLFEAYGNVKILDGDSVTITAESLIYYGREKKASLIGNVVYTSGDKKLYTDKLDYDIVSKVSYFFEGGRLIDEQNDLTSKIGYYYSQTDLAVFYDSVRLKAETFDLATDTLKYFTVPKIAFTDGPTTIISESGNTIDNTGGKYETVKEKMELVGGKVETIDYYLEGDELFLDDYTQYYKATGNVKLTAKNNDVIITGNEGYYDKASGLSKVYGNPVMKKIMAVDTFYLSADTLVAIEAEADSAKRILGFKDVRIFKENLQGITDSLSYFLSDSIIFMYKDPVLWTTKNQISGDTISLLIKDKYVEKMNLYRNSFMVSQDTLRNFNQVKGRNMVAEFNMNDIERIHVLGNCESLYFALSQNEDYLIGMNKVTCSNMIMLFEKNELSGLNFYKKPDASMTPPHELSASTMKLPGFQWRSDERPTLSYVLLRPEKVKKAATSGEQATEENGRQDSSTTGKKGDLLINRSSIEIEEEEKQ